MTDNIKTSLSVIYTEDSINKQSRFMDDTITHVPISYEHGKTSIPGKAINFELATSVNLICLSSVSQFNIKLGNTTDPELTNLRMFVYDGDTTNLFVSNTSTDPIVIKVVTAKY